MKFSMQIALRVFVFCRRGCDDPSSLKVPPISAEPGRISNWSSSPKVSTSLWTDMKMLADEPIYMRMDC
jgi:hypothetical protein